MKASICVILSAVLLFEVMTPGTDIRELAKIPALLQHYRVHKRFDHHISLQDFIKLHYSDAEHHRKDPGTHHDLPFSDHQAHYSQLHQTVFTLPEAIAAIQPAFLPIEEISYVTTPKELRFSSPIWQPPRIC